MTNNTADSILRAGLPSRTALRVALLRAAHQLLDEPIVLEDPVALPILGAVAEAEMRNDPFQYNDPISRGLRALLVVRSRFAEDEVAKAVAAGVDQYVVLGAGLDTFAYRNRHGEAALHIFEVDHPATQQWKRQLLQDAAIPLPGNLTFAPTDFEHGTLAKGLADAGFQADRPACFSWLGVTMYLTEATIMETLGFVASMPKGSSITFDFRVSSSLLNPIERVVSEVIAQRTAAIGEPLRSEFEPAVLREKVHALGFSEVTTCEPDELNLRYLNRRKDGLRSGGRMLLARI